MSNDLPRDSTVDVFVTGGGINILSLPPAFHVDTIMYSDMLREVGGSDDMKVDGSSTPIEFSYTAPVEEVLTELRLFFMDGGDGKPHEFGTMDKLPNGLLLEIVKAGVRYPMFNVQHNIDILTLFSSHVTAGKNMLIEDKEAYSGSIMFLGDCGIKLNVGDSIVATVRDELHKLDDLELRVKLCRRI